MSNQDYFHPERRPNEVFIGNYPAKAALALLYKSIRIGDVPYDMYGRLANYPGRLQRTSPIFCSLSEWKSRM